MEIEKFIGKTLNIDVTIEEIKTEYNTEKTQWTLFNNMVVFDSKSTTDATLTYTLTRVSPDFLHLTKGGATIVFERLVRRGL